MENDVREVKHFAQYVEIRQSLVILLAKILFLEFIITFVHIFINILLPTHHIHDINLGLLDWQTWELLIFHAVNTFLILAVVMNRVSTYYIINNLEVAHETGILSKHRTSFDITGIQEISYSQSFIWRICSYWTITLENPLVKSCIYLKNIPKPDFYTKLIRTERDRAIRDVWTQFMPVSQTHTHW